jgi:peptidyl-prolyl cis-trans isomerase SurA
MMTKMFLRFFAFLVCLAGPLLAADTGIVAVVNDDVITNTDVKDRMGLVFLSSGLDQDAESIRRVKERVLRNLIDEQLQMQESKHYDIDIENEEIDKAFEKVAGQNQMSATELHAYMRQRGVPEQTLENQIRAALSWSKVVQKVLRSQVEVGDDEVNAVLERIKANEGKPEYLMSEIFLPVENPTDDDKVRELAENLVERLKQGTSFAALAQQFSRGTGAINGGDLDWVQPGQMQGELDQAVRKLDVGQVSLPIRTTDGYYLLAKRKERVISATDPDAVQLKLKQASFPLNGQSLDSARVDIEKFRQAASSCSALATPASQFPQWKVQDLGIKRLVDLPPWLQNIVRNQSVDQPSSPLEASGYAILLYVCERNDSGANRSAIMNSLGNEKLDLQARRLLRDLRRAASIDIRGS